MPYDGVLAANLASQKARNQAAPPNVKGSPCTAAVDEIIQSAGGGASCTNTPGVATSVISSIPAGSVIGFYTAAGKMVHAMISLGRGDAAGCNNGCVGGSPTPNWEKMKIALPIRHYSGNLVVKSFWPT